MIIIIFQKIKNLIFIQYRKLKEVKMKKVIN